jgi:hypothetical protein
MTPNPTSDDILTPVPTPRVGEWALRLAVTKRVVRPDLILTEGTTYRNLPINHTLKPDVHLWGDYLLTKVEPGPPGYDYYWFGKPKTDLEKRTPYYDEPGDGRHYQWPTVLHGVLFAEDYEFPVETRIGVDLTVERARLVAKVNKTDEAFALCATRIKKYLAPTAFKQPERIQPTTSEVEWVINGVPERLSCLHRTITLPAAGRDWSLKYSVGNIPGLPGETRTFPATPMADWEPFVISRTHRQREDIGLYELVEEWVIPPDRAAQPTF